MSRSTRSEANSDARHSSPASPCLESVPIQLRPGRIERTDETVIYITRDGRGRATLPLKSEPYLQAFHQVTDLETLIMDWLARGLAIDYRLLKTTVLALYHGNCIANAYEFRPFIEAWQQPPLQEPSLLTALARAHPSRKNKGLFVFFAAVLALAAWIFMILPMARSGLGSGTRFFVFVFLTPGALLSFQALGLWLLDSLAGSGRARLGARLSPMGLHLEADVRAFHSRPWGALTFCLASSYVLPLLALRASEAMPFSHGAGPTAFEFLRDLTPIFVALSLLPGLRSPLSLARAELTKRGHMRGPGAAPSVSAKINGLFVTAAIIGLCASFAAIADAAVGAAHTLLPPFPTYVVGGGIATLLSLIPFGWAFLILTDLMAAIESLADDLELLNPVRDQIQQVWTWLRAGRTQSELRKIRTSLDRHPLFLSLAPQMRESLCLGARLISAPRGARLIRQGSRSTDLYLLVRGSVGVYRRDSMTQQSEMVLRLSSGSVFGEAGFFLDQERTADIVALEGCEVIKMARPAAFKPQENVNAQDGFRKKIWASQVLSGHPIFQRLPAEAILHILNFSEILTLPPRHWLMREGEASDGLWILIQGSAAVSVRGAARPDVSSGAVLGEIGLLWNSPRTASVHATSECVALKLSAPAFRSLVSRNLNFGARLQELGADRLERDRQSA